MRISDWSSDVCSSDLPEDFGIAMAASRNLRVADPAGSKAMLLEALGDELGLPLEIVALNAGAALYVAGVADSIADGIVRSREAIASGAAMAKLREFVEATQRSEEHTSELQSLQRY